jgi:hypothetical protein
MKAISIVSMKIVVEPRRGAQIDEVIREMCGIANKTGGVVDFQMSGARLSAEPGDSVAALRADFMRQMAGDCAA